MIQLASEKNAIRDVSFSANRNWRVANTHATNSLGQFIGYTLAPGAAAPVFALPGSAPGRTGGFTEHQRWATPHAPAALYAGGEDHAHPTAGRLAVHAHAPRELPARDDVVLRPESDAGRAEMSTRSRKSRWYRSPDPPA